MPLGGVCPMTFLSILFNRPEDRAPEETLEAPDFFGDLNLDQVVDAITLGKQEYNLKPFFYTPLHDTDAIMYRHEIMRDLENNVLFAHVTAFAEKMHTMRAYLAQVDKLHYTYQKERWFLDAVEIYCDAVTSLVDDLSRADVQSRGFLAFRDYMANYARSDSFTSLMAETKQIKADLSAIQYCLLIKGNRIQVRKYEGEADYSMEVEETFAKFKQGAVEDYRVKFPSWPDMNHIEAQVLDQVARLYPEIFTSLDSYCTKHANFMDETVALFDREVQFYIAYLDHVRLFERERLRFCYPQISCESKEIYGYDEFDLALAYKLINDNEPVVCNDFYLRDPERIFVVSGPNQGGKTTFARTFGQMHYLGSLGCPVPGWKAQLFLFDRLFTHFEREENIKNLHGKLQDDLIRIHSILDQATPNSIIIMNEIFNSTTLEDAIFLSKKILEEIIALDLLCVCVTFIDELASLSEKTVSMVSTIVPENPTLRTYKVVRRPADGLAYAISIAEKYQLTYDRLKERIRS
jgi:DNA mismatch repair protein MutS